MGATSTKDYRSLREWIAKGCSLEADILPSCREFAAGKTEIRNCFNEAVREKTFNRRDYHLRGGGNEPCDSAAGG